MEEFVPNVCTSAPVKNKAFCKSHTEQIEEKKIPTDLKTFLKWCGTDAAPVNPENYNISMEKRFKEVLKTIPAKLENFGNVSAMASHEAQGTSYLLRDRNLLNHTSFQLEGGDQVDDCNK